MPIPVPTVGRKVYYFASSNQTEPWDATVIKVLDDNGTHSAVNLVVTDPDTGISAFRGRIRYETERFMGERFDWMEYQKRDVQPTQAGYSTAGMLAALVLCCACTLAAAKGNPAALAKYRAEKAAAGKVEAAPKAAYVVPSAGKWSKK